MYATLRVFDTYTWSTPLDQIGHPLRLPSRFHRYPAPPDRYEIRLQLRRLHAQPKLLVELACRVHHTHVRMLVTQIHADIKSERLFLLLLAIAFARSLFLAGILFHSRSPFAPSSALSLGA